MKNIIVAVWGLKQKHHKKYIERGPYDSSILHFDNNFPSVSHTKLLYDMEYITHKKVELYVAFEPFWSLKASVEERKSNRFGATRRWVNDDKVFIFGWTNPLVKEPFLDSACELGKDIICNYWIRQNTWVNIQCCKIFCKCINSYLNVYWAILASVTRL